MLDDRYIFSVAQAITATADSTNTVNLGQLFEEFSLDAGTQVLREKLGPKSGRINLVIGVETTFVGAGGTLSCKLQDSTDDVTFANTDIIGAAEAVGVLVAGYQLMNIPLPANLSQYAKVVYTVGTGFSAGNVNAQLEFGTMNL